MANYDDNSLLRAIRKKGFFLTNVNEIIMLRCLRGGPRGPTENKDLPKCT
jgi:hypothetical protein